MASNVKHGTCTEGNLGSHDDAATFHYKSNTIEPQEIFNMKKEESTDWNSKKSSKILAGEEQDTPYIMDQELT